MLSENKKQSGEKGLSVGTFAGSTWTEDDNNKMSILDAEGNLLGEYYKYSPFVKKERERILMNAMRHLAIRGKKSVI